MANELGINKLEYAHIYNNMVNASTGLNVNRELWYSQGERSEAFTGFTAKKFKMETLMIEYRELLFEDVKGVGKTAEELTKTDEMLSESLK